MTSVLRSELSQWLGHPSAASRTRLYGLCVLVALSFLVAGRAINGSDLWAEMYLPFAGGTMLVLCVAGVELVLYRQRFLADQVSLRAEQQRAERLSLERQRAFNHLWQSLADSRGEPAVPTPVLADLAGLFGADLVIVWAVDPIRCEFRLRGAHPVTPELATRLDKVGLATPWPERLGQAQVQVRHGEFAKHLAPGIAWVCEDCGLQAGVFNPVLVRHEVVGVLAFLYRESAPVSPKLAEEMQAAANLFLSAL